MSIRSNQLRRTWAEAVRRFFEGYLGHLEGRIREGDQFDFYKNLKGVDVELNGTFIPQYINNEEGRLLRENAPIRERWVRWLHKMLNTNSPTLDPTIAGELMTWPPCRPLDGVPSRYQVEQVIRALANRKAVGLDGLPVELLKALADEGEPDTLGKFHEIIVAVWRGGGVPPRWNYATIKVVHKEEISGGMWKASWHLSRGSRRQSSPQNHRGSP